MERSPSAAPARTPRKAAFASWIGSAVEYYDFFIYGTAAALVFGKIFFPSIDPALATVAAFATFGVGYVTRPIGAFFMGHIGDKFGRKKVLTMTLLLMGASTFAIGLLPTYQQVGITAPILLVVLRLLQGLSAAGEQAGANSMTLEHAPDHRRAFFTSFTLSGTQMGFILATIVFLPISTLSEQDLLSWGWRIPFFLSAIVVAVGVWVRRTLPETPAFAEEAAHHETPKLPMAELFSNHTPDVLRVVFAALVSVVSTIFGVFVLSYAVNTMHLPRTQMLVLIFVFGLLMSGVVYSAANGIWPSLYGEMFDTRVRLSGMAIGTQIGFALGGFAPTISAAILRPGPDGWMPVAVLVSASCIIAAISVLSARETYNVPMHLLGKPGPGRLSLA